MPKLEVQKAPSKSKEAKMTGKKERKVPPQFIHVLVVPGFKGKKHFECRPNPAWDEYQRIIANEAKG